jgi:HAD superfamily phosphoserine phosphatase-like hydrolase
MRIESPERIRARIVEARGMHAGGVVAFDGDGTLWSGDVGEDFFHALVATGDVRDAAQGALAREAAEFGLKTEGTALQLAERLYGDYLAGLYPEDRVCTMMAWAFAGWTRGEMEAFADATLAAAHLGTRLHREATETLAWAAGEGIEVFVVSASPRAIVERAAKRVGVAPDHVVAADPAFDGDRVLARIERPIPYGDGKVRHLRARVGDERPLYAAFGDNAFDVPMLREAFVPVAVRPKPRLRDRAGDVKDLVEIEPRD